MKKIIIDEKAIYEASPTLRPITEVDALNLAPSMTDQLIESAIKAQTKAQESEIRRILATLGHNVDKDKDFIKFLSIRCMRTVEERGEYTIYVLMVDEKPLIIWNSKIDIQFEGTKATYSFTKPQLL